MNIYKTISIFLLFAYEAIAFSNAPNIINRINNISLFIKNKPLQRRPNYITKLNLHRSELWKVASVIPYIITKPAIAAIITKEKTIEELRKEALNIIDIIEVQKNTINLPSLNDTNNNDIKGIGENDDNYNNDNKQVSSKTRVKIDSVLNNIMNDFKKNGNIDPIKSVSNLQKYCSKSNILKYKNVRGIIASFQDGKYALLLGKFIDYEIIDYQKDIDNNSDEKNNVYYNVDMKITADYKTMLQNSIQFNDMYYPKNRDNNNVCYVIYRWSFKKYEDDNLYLEGCYLVPAKQY
jgi:hypothetical protein